MGAQVWTWPSSSSHTAVLWQWPPWSRFSLTSGDRTQDFLLLGLAGGWLRLGKPTPRGRAWAPSWRDPALLETRSPSVKCTRPDLASVWICLWVEGPLQGERIDGSSLPLHGSERFILKSLRYTKSPFWGSCRGVPSPTSYLKESWGLSDDVAWAGEAVRPSEPLDEDSKISLPSL